MKVGRIDRSSIERALDISDGAWSWSSWMTNLWARRQVGDTDIRKKNVLVLVCGPEPYVLGFSPWFHLLIRYQ